MKTTIRRSCFLVFSCLLAAFLATCWRPRFALAATSEGPTSALALETPCRLSEVAPSLDRREPRRPGEVALTFDDGPHPVATRRVLDTLKLHKLKATFFLVGHSINHGTYHLVRRMFEEGHELGSHSYNHDLEMAYRDFGSQGRDYVVSQHQVTSLLIELALVATSRDDFDTLFRRVLKAPAMAHLSSHTIRTQLPQFQARFEQVLRERGLPHPYQVFYTRPPGGGPYLGDTPAGMGRRLYDSALRRLGMVNVLWHGGAGDTDAKRRLEVPFLRQQLGASVRRGGVVLIHDTIQHQALAGELALLAGNPKLRVVPLAHFVQQRFGCSVTTLQRVLRARAQTPEQRL